MQRYTHLLLLSSLVTTCGGPSRAGPGLHYPPYPQGYKVASGSLIPSSVGGTDYSIELLTSHLGDQLWFSQLVGRDRAGRPQWLLLDTMPTPDYPRDQRLVISTCRVDGQVDQAVIAVVKNEDLDSLRTVFRAWRADAKLQRFALIPTAGIVCENEGYRA